MLRRRLTKRRTLDSAQMLSTCRSLIRAIRNSRYRVLPFDDPDMIRSRYSFNTTTNYARRVTDEYRKHRDVKDKEEIARLHQRALHVFNLHDAIYKHERYLYDGGWRTKRTQRDMINITAQNVGFSTPLKKTKFDTFDPDNPEPLVKGSKEPSKGLGGFRWTERAPLSSGGVHEDIFTGVGDQGEMLGGPGQAPDPPLTGLGASGLETFADSAASEFSASEAQDLNGLSSKQ